MVPTLPPSVPTILAIRSTAVPTNASSASAGRMSMHSYSLNVHLLWSGRPPRRGSRRMRAVQSVRDDGSGSRYGGSSGPRVPIEPVPEHVSDHGGLTRSPRARHGQLVRDLTVRDRVAAAVERPAGEDAEPSVAEGEELGPWLLDPVAHRSASLRGHGRTVAA